MASAAPTRHLILVQKMNNVVINEGILLNIRICMGWFVQEIDKGIMPLFHETGDTQENSMNNKHEMFLFSCTQTLNSLYYMEYSQVNY